MKVSIKLDLEETKKYFELIGLLDIFNQLVDSMVEFNVYDKGEIELFIANEMLIAAEDWRKKQSLNDKSNDVSNYGQ